MLKKLFVKLTAFVNGEKKKKNSPLSVVPDAVMDKLVDQAEVLADAADNAVANVTEEVKKEVANVTKAVKKTSTKKKPATKKKPSSKKGGGGGGALSQVD